MSELEQVITWLRTYEGHDILKDWHVDYTDQVPSCGAVFPQGLQEIERRTYITGAVCVTNQSNFGLYFTFAKSAGDDEARRSTQIGSTTSSIGCRSRVPTALLQTLATPKSLSSPAPRTVCCTKRRPKARRLIWSC